MRWWIALALISVIGSGCRAPAPTLDPFAPYGNRVIPPPPTGSIGSPHGYYQPAPTGVPTSLPGPPATSQNPLQPVPAVATPPTTPRTSALPNEGNWESSDGSNGFGYVAPTRQAAAMPPTLSGGLQHNQHLPWGIRSQGSEAYAAAPSATYIPAAPIYHSPGNPITPTQYLEPFPATYGGGGIRPSSLRSFATTGGYVDAGCCEPVGDALLVPQADPRFGTVTPPGYGPVTTAQTTGWRRRR